MAHAHRIVLVGWGAFNLVEGIIDHQLLGIHHVRDDLGAPIGWDIGFLVFGLLLLLGGLALARSGPRSSKRRRPTRRQPFQVSATRTTRNPSGFLERQPVLRPVRVRRRDRIGAEPRRGGPHRRVVAEVEHEERLRVGSGARCPPPVVSSRCAPVPGIARKTPS